MIWISFKRLCAQKGSENLDRDKRGDHVDIRLSPALAEIQINRRRIEWPVGKSYFGRQVLDDLLSTCGRDMVDSIS